MENIPLPTDLITSIIHLMEDVSSKLVRENARLARHEWAYNLIFLDLVIRTDLCMLALSKELNFHYNPIVEDEKRKAMQKYIDSSIIEL